MVRHSEPWLARNLGNSLEGRRKVTQDFGRGFGSQFSIPSRTLADFPSRESMTVLETRPFECAPVSSGRTFERKSYEKEKTFRVRYDDWEVIINGARDARHALAIAQSDYQQFHHDKFFYPDAIVEAVISSGPSEV